MPDIPFVQVFVLLAFVLVPLLIQWLERIRRRFETQARREPPRQPAPRTFAKSPPLEVISSARERAPAPQNAGAPLRLRPPRRERRFFHGRRELRRAIVLMEVLGPCRGVDSRHESR
jgi:hypothetical protein